jgi:hypothetical protein
MRRKPAAHSAPKLPADSIVEMRALRARVAEAQRKLGELDMQRALLDQQRGLLVQQCAMEMRALDETGNKALAAIGLDPKQRWGVDAETGEVKPA